MFIKGYSQFITEKESANQFQQLALTVAIDMPDNQYIYDPAFNTSKMWKLVTKEDKQVGGLKIPVLNYSNWQTKRILKTGYDPKLVYNSSEAKKKVSSKKDWHMIHEGSLYVPKSVYDYKEVHNLSFPVVAKPENRYGGQGIVVFTSPGQMQSKEVEMKMEQFAVFSEKIDIAEEFRVFCWKGEPVTTMYRVPANEETEDLSKDPKDKLKFNYELATKAPEDSFKIIKEFADKHTDLDFYSVDFARTPDGDLYVIEMSSEPGPIFGVLGEIYKRMHVHHYDQELSQANAEQIDRWIKEDIDATIASDPKRFKIRKDGL